MDKLAPESESDRARVELFVSTAKKFLEKYGYFRELDLNTMVPPINHFEETIAHINIKDYTPQGLRGILLGFEGHMQEQPQNPETEKIIDEARKILEMLPDRYY